MPEELKHLQTELAAAWKRLDLDADLAKIQQLEAQLADPKIWQDNQLAQEQTKLLASLEKTVHPWVKLRDQVSELVELSADASLAAELAEPIAAAKLQLANLGQQLLFRGEYDKSGAILRLSAGAGGDDAQDWTEMLERMYLRWAEQNDYVAKVVERSAGETAGVKTSVVEINGRFAYGKLRSENGVHRLVRLSPFNAESRETSFARVEVLPQIDQPETMELDDKDLKIDVYRASGHGGQSVNTTDSAVRVTHLPTGLVVAIQNEKSQIKNKAEALKILRGKLAALQLEQNAADLAEIKGESRSAAWGQQIRNYVLHPYKLVKDTRTGVETANIDKVLDGDLNQFIEAYLSML